MSLGIVLQHTGLFYNSNWYYMNKTYRQGATGAILDEYEKVITELIAVISDVSNEELVAVADSKTPDENCSSIQNVLAHVVRSGYSYAMYIREIGANNTNRPEFVYRSTIKEYQTDLNNVFMNTVNTFQNITDDQLEENDNSKKIVTHWEQEYDIEQMMEHAIVHILRHRRQIEKFKITLRSEK
jgi:uncharacterized damage-inducible protein DinB